MQGGGTQEGASCLICCDDLLEKETCALRCGHVYHFDCFQQWLSAQVAQGKKGVVPGECPSCKQVSQSSQLRRLKFEVVEFRTGLMEEAQRVEEATEEEQEQMLQELDAQRMQAEADFEEVEQEIGRQQESAQAHKRARREAVQNITKEEAEIADLNKEYAKSVVDCAQLRTSLDSQCERQRQQLPIPPIREGDADLHTERKKLKHLRAPDRARQLHEALVSAQAQEAEAGHVARERAAAVQAAEAERNLLREEETRLRRVVAELRERLRGEEAAAGDPLFSQSDPASSPRRKELRRQPSNSSVAASSVGRPPGRQLSRQLSGSTAPPGRQLSRQLSGSSARSVGGASSASAVAGTAAARAAKPPAQPPAASEEEEDGDPLFGSKKRSAAGGIALLAVAGARAAAPPRLATARKPGVFNTAACPTPIRTERGLKSLFNKVY